MITTYWASFYDGRTTKIATCFIVKKLHQIPHKTSKVVAINENNIVGIIKKYKVVTRQMKLVRIWWRQLHICQIIYNKFICQ